MFFKTPCFKNLPVFKVQIAWSHSGGQCVGKSHFIPQERVIRLSKKKVQEEKIGRDFAVAHFKKTFRSEGGKLELYLDKKEKFITIKVI